MMMTRRREVDESEEKESSSEDEKMAPTGQMHMTQGGLEGDTISREDSQGKGGGEEESQAACLAG